MRPFDTGPVRRTYDAVAEEYAAAFGDDLERLPLDRQVLDDVAGAAIPGLAMVDLGCGPAQVGGYLEAAGKRVIGVDISLQLLAVARRRNITVPFVCGDIRSLPLRDQSCGGVVAFYSLPFLPRPLLPVAMAEIRRVLAPGGTIAVATHLGEGKLRGANEWMGHQVEPLVVVLYTSDELEQAVVEAGFVVDTARFREPLPHEHEGQRIYLTAHRPRTDPQPAGA